MCLLQMIYHVLTFAFLMVIASTAVMTPILLYIFDLRNTGWLWQHAALFSAMIAPTDAVSVSSVLKKGQFLHLSSRDCISKCDLCFLCGDVLSSAVIAPTAPVCVLYVSPLPSSAGMD